MTKVTLDMSTFKALASGTRLDILRVLDGKHLSLNDICKETNLNKATLHEHLTKLHEVGLVKRKEREGHKWVYYTLSWKGESLLHPENTKIVVLFTTTFLALWAGIIALMNYVKGTVTTFGHNIFFSEGGRLAQTGAEEDGLTAPLNEAVKNGDTLSFGLTGGSTPFYQDPIFVYIALACFLVFVVALVVAMHKLSKNKTAKL